MEEGMWKHMVYKSIFMIIKMTFDYTSWMEEGKWGFMKKDKALFMIIKLALNYVFFLDRRKEIKLVNKIDLVNI